MTIQVLKKQGQSIKAISRETGISRNTVKKYLNNDSATPQYTRRVKKLTKLDPYMLYIQERIRSAAPEWIPAAVLYREIIELGYPGKVRMVSDYVAQFKPTTQAEPLVRFETEPGEQLQVDFTIIRRQGQPIKAFVATLGYSRATYVCFFDNEPSESWLTGLRQCFDFFGGVPKEVLFDNAKTIVLERDAYGAGLHRWHPQLLLLAKEYGFQPRACRPYRAKTKGKVERFNRYLKGSFIVPLQASLRAEGLKLDVQTANACIGRWLQSVANARVHGTTQEIPNQRLVKERDALLPLPIRVGNKVALRSSTDVPVPFESIQHPLSTYDALLGDSHELTI